MATTERLQNILKKIVMKSKLLIFFFGFFVFSCSSYQYSTITYKPFSKRLGYTLDIPANFIQRGLFAENDYCYEYFYNHKDFFSAIIYIHYYPMSFLIDEVSENVRIFYGDSVFCKLYDVDLDEEEAPSSQPLHNQHIIDRVLQLTTCPDTLTLSGKNDSIAWKEIRIKNTIVIGYFNVPVRKRKLFDKALSSLRTIDSTDYIDEYRKKMMSEDF